MKQYVVDVFTELVFKGNPAAVCVMDKWPGDEFMIGMSVENNLSETAFAVKEEGNRYHLRWFTPGGEIELCGHATLAAGYVLLNYYEKDAEEIVFDSLSGELRVVRGEDGVYEEELPAFDLKQVEVTKEIVDALGATPTEVWQGADLLCIFDDEDVVRNLVPDQAKVKELYGVCLHASARGRDTDTVTRTFAPKCNVEEDPVCGRGHCHVTPYWTKRLGKDRIVAYQASRRGGTLYCAIAGDRVRIGGKVTMFSIDEILAVPT